MSKYRRVRFFETQTVKSLLAMEATQLVLSQFKNFLTQWIENWIRSLCAKNKYVVNVVNWWSYLMLNVAVRFFWDTVYIKIESQKCEGAGILVDDLEISLKVIQTFRGSIFIYGINKIVHEQKFT